MPVRSVLHLIWLGGCPPMRNIANLHRISQMFSARLDADAALPEPDRPYMPLLWMDASALDAMLAQSVIALELARVPQLPQAWLDVAQASLRAHARHCKWLKISIHQQDCFMPVVLLEDMQSTLDDLWAIADAANQSRKRI